MNANLPKLVAIGLLSMAVAALVYWQVLQDDASASGPRRASPAQSSVAGSTSSAAKVSQPTGGADSSAVPVVAEEIEAIASGVEGAACLAVDGQGRLYVGGRDRLRIWDDLQAEPRDLALPQKAHALAVLADGRICVGLEQALLVFDQAGGQLLRREYAEKSQVRGLATDGETVYVADAGRRIVHVHSDRPDAPAALARAEGRDDGVIVYRPSLGIAVDRQGLVWLADPGRHRVKLYAPDGTLISAWASRPGQEPQGFSGCCNPARLAVLSDGRVVTSEKGVLRVKLFAADGDLQGLIAPTAAFPKARGGEDAADVAVDRRDRILLLDPTDARVRVFRLLNAWSVKAENSSAARSTDAPGDFAVHPEGD